MVRATEYPKADSLDSVWNKAKSYDCWMIKAHGRGP
jgi:hypothetical protein